MLQNKIAVLNNAKSQAFSIGDLERLNALDKDLLGTQNTIAQLNLLLTATQAANVSNLDVASVLTAGVQAAQAAASVPDAPTAVLSQYDISTYASDPAYIQKITDMLTQMPVFDNAVQIDTYISNEIVGSPITGQMVLDAVAKYAVDARLMVAIMELDSRLGTAGTGASTFNPGNVGNTGTSITTYASWADGVAAVAYWLSQHRIGGPTPVTVVPDLSAADSTLASSTPAAVLPVLTPTTVATSTPAVATTTPPVVINPPLPVSTVSTSTDPTVLTPVASSTDPISPAATSTNPTATSTPPTVDTATSTPSSTLDTSTASTTPTTDTATTTPDNTLSASSTLPTDFTDPSVATSTNATSTSDVNASSTQARRVVIGKRRRV